jgi:hypothetical protein
MIGIFLSMATSIHATISWWMEFIQGEVVLFKKATNPNIKKSHNL